MDFKNLPPDRTASTYMHVIKMVTGVEIVGFSKKEGRNEPADKRALLMGTIARIVPAYMEQGLYSAEFYRQRIVGATVQKELVLEITQTHFVLKGYLEKDIPLRRFLNAFYAGDVDAVQGMLAKRSSADDFRFDPKTQNQADLLDLCKRLVNLYEREKVEQFYHACLKMLEKGGAGTRVPSTRKANEAQPLASLISNLMPEA